MSNTNSNNINIIIDSIQDSPIQNQSKNQSKSQQTDLELNESSFLNEQFQKKIKNFKEFLRKITSINRKSKEETEDRPSNALSLSNIHNTDKSHFFKSKHQVDYCFSNENDNSQVERESFYLYRKKSKGIYFFSEYLYTNTLIDEMINQFILQNSSASEIEDEEGNSILHFFAKSSKEEEFEVVFFIIKEQLFRSQCEYYCNNDFISYIVSKRNLKNQNIFDIAILNKSNDIYIFLFEFLEVSVLCLKGDNFTRLGIGDSHSHIQSSNFQCENRKTDFLKSENESNSIIRLETKLNQNDLLNSKSSRSQESMLNKIKSQEKTLKTSFEAKESLTIKVNRMILQALGLVSDNKMGINNFLHWIAISNNIYIMYFLIQKLKISNQFLFEVMSKSQSQVNDRITKNEYEYEYLVLDRNAYIKFNPFHENINIIPHFINKVNEYSVSPIQYACFYENKTLLNIFISLGSDLNHYDEKGQFVVNYAVKSKNLEVIKKIILSGGILRGRKNQNDKTAFDMIDQHELNENYVINEEVDGNQEENEGNDERRKYLSCIYDDYNLKKRQELITQKKKVNLKEILRESKICEKVYSLRLELSPLTSMKNSSSVLVLFLVFTVIYSLLIIFTYIIQYIHHGQSEHKTFYIFYIILSILSIFLSSSIFIIKHSISSLNNHTSLNTILNSKKKNQIFEEFLKTTTRICVICNKTQSNSTVHCLKCNVCIENWSHHCFLLGTCISNTCLKRFNMLIITLVTKIFIETILSFWFFYVLISNLIESSLFNFDFLVLTCLLFSIVYCLLVIWIVIW